MTNIIDVASDFQYCAVSISLRVWVQEGHWRWCNGYVSNIWNVSNDGILSVKAPWLLSSWYY